MDGYYILNTFFWSRTNHKQNDMGGGGKNQRTTKEKRPVWGERNVKRETGKQETESARRKHENPQETQKAPRNKEQDEEATPGPPQAKACGGANPQDTEAPAGLPGVEAGTTPQEPKKQNQEATEPRKR